MPDAAVDLPREIYDPNISGLFLNTKLRCFHGGFPQRKVTFDVAATGRRILGCPRNVTGRCSFLEWIDDPWTPELSRALIHLWNLVGLPYRGELALDEGSMPMCRAYVALLVEKTWLEDALQNIQISSKNKEQKFKELIHLIRKKESRSIRCYATVCVSAISVAATLRAVVVFMLSR
uniref:Uncharacterized protein n=1 Tax=Avena sativa TaxID=4498 RepID=A0ACD5X2C8_AVESA